MHATLASQTKPLNPESTGEYAAYFTLKGLDLVYIDYILSIRFEVKKGELTETRDIDLPLEQDYREYRSNALWDALMGV